MKWLRRIIFTAQMSSCDRLEALDCCWKGNLARLSELLSSGLDPDFKAVDGIPLLNATILGDELKESQKITVLQLLLDAGSHLRVTDRKGASALMIACASKQNEIVNFLLNKGADPNQADKGGDTAIFYAASSGNSDAVRVLILASADIKKKNKLGRTALMWAAREGHLEIVRLLVEAGALIECEDRDQIRLIRQAASRGHKAVTEYLLGRSPQEKQFLSLGEAASCGLQQLVCERLEAGEDMNSRNSNGFSALDLAIMYERTQMVDYLIARGPSRASLGHALGVAVLSKSVEIAQALISAGAEVNHCDETGTTPLMFAAEKNLPVLAKLLLQSGADPKRVNQGNDTAVDIAQRESAYDALQVIYRHK